MNGVNFEYDKECKWNNDLKCLASKTISNFQNNKTDVTQIC